MSISRQMLLVRALLTGTLLTMAAGAQAQGWLGYVSGVPHRRRPLRGSR